MKKLLLSLIGASLLLSCKTTPKSEGWVCTYEGVKQGNNNEDSQNFIGTHPTDKDAAKANAADECKKFFKRQDIQDFKCSSKGCQDNSDSDNDDFGDVSVQSNKDKWYSKKYDRHFDKNGECKQYNETDSNTCETKKDNLKCEWKRARKKCKER